MAGESLAGGWCASSELNGDSMTGDVNESFISFRFDEECAGAIAAEQSGRKVSGGSNRHNVNPKDFFVGIDNSLIARG